MEREKEEGAGEGKRARKKRTGVGGRESQSCFFFSQLPGDWCLTDKRGEVGMFLLSIPHTAASLLLKIGLLSLLLKTEIYRFYRD